MLGQVSMVIIYKFKGGKTVSNDSNKKKLSDNAISTLIIAFIVLLL